MAPSAEASDHLLMVQMASRMACVMVSTALLALYMDLTTIATAQEAVTTSVPCDPKEQGQSVHLNWDENRIKVTIGKGDCLCDESSSRIKAFLQEAVQEKRSDQINSDKRWRLPIEFSPEPGETTAPRVVHCYSEKAVNKYLKESGLPELVARDIRGR